MLGLAKRLHARVLQASTSEVYGDPLVHPQDESYWGHVNPIGLRACYDEGTLFFDYLRQHGLDIKLSALVVFMDSEPGLTGSVNFGNPTESTMLELAELVLKLTGSPFKVAFTPLPSDDPRQRCPNITLAKTQLGWSPQVTLEDSLRETVAYFRKELAR
jgi:UDP-glucuronate decarboxylase